MKKKSNSTMIAGDIASNIGLNLRTGDEQNASIFNSDLDCVITGEQKEKRNISSK